MPSPTAAIKRMLRPVRRRLNQALGRDLCFPVQVRGPRLRLGSEYGGWVIQPHNLTKHSVVYSFGAGEDISFDLAMIERFGVTVHAFDPTPKSMKWIKSQTLPPQFVFHSIGLADHDGTARFVLPRANFTSYQMSGQENAAGADVVDAPVQQLSTIMRDLGHDRIEVLKMDIEGAEYAALPNIIDARIAVQQLLVEFHHTAGDRPSLEKSRHAIEALQRAGYRIFDVSATGMEYSFIR